MTFENTYTTPDWSGYYDAINWDAVKDPVDKMTLDKLNSQFYLYFGSISIPYFY